MRILIESLDRRFADLDVRQRKLLEPITEDRLFRTPVSTPDSLVTLSVGGAVIRSAAMVEQVFLGLTRRLWDDPFEWTLPERLSTREAITEYLDEVQAARAKAMLFLVSDADLSRHLPAPEKLRPIFEVLLEALARAENYLGRGEVIGKIIK